jgi:hypothetical protein
MDGTSDGDIVRSVYYGALRHEQLAYALLRPLGDASTDSVYDYHRCDYFVGSLMRYDGSLRDKEAEEAAGLLSVRQERRMLGSPTTKECNPLLSIPGSPGVGKRSFLKHFPCSLAFYNYCTKMKDTATPIVAPVKFSGMQSSCYREGIVFGLRTIYAASRCMGHIQADLSWDDFNKLCTAFANITLSDALSVLWRLFGRGRRVIVLVDGIQKAVKCESAGDDAVMSSIGAALNVFGNVDFLVASPSPSYIHDLVSRASLRSIDHVTLAPLYELKEGIEASRAWADRVLPGLGADNSVTSLCRRVTRLASGNGQTLSELTTLLRADGLTLPRTTARSFQESLQWLARQVVDVCGLPSPSAQCLEDLILSCEPVDLHEDRVGRTALERGAVHIQRKAFARSKRLFFLYVPLAVLLDMQTTRTDRSTRFPRTQLLRDLFVDVAKISDLWERAVDMTLLVRPASRPGGLVQLSNVFGIAADIGSIQYEHPLVIGLQLNRNMQLTLSRPPIPGSNSVYDVRRSDGETVRIYVQNELPQSSKTQLSTAYGLSVYQCVLHQVGQWPGLNATHIVFYDYGASTSVIDHEDVARVALERVMEGLSSGQCTAKEADLVRSFVAHHIHNVHVVPRPVLAEWLIPSFVDLPVLAADAWAEENSLSSTANGDVDT